MYGQEVLGACLGAAGCPARAVSESINSRCCRLREINANADDIEISWGLKCPWVVPAVTIPSCARGVKQSEISIVLARVR